MEIGRPSIYAYINREKETPKAILKSNQTGDDNQHFEQNKKKEEIHKLII